MLLFIYNKHTISVKGKEMTINIFKLEYLDKLPATIKKMVDQGHAKDESNSGIICSYNPFSIIAKNSDDKTIAVLSAYTAYAEIYVDDLWVSPKYRSQNIGRKLLIRLEETFEDEGYNNINLVTNCFQAAEFYKKCGFKQEFIRINKQNPKLTKIFFIKYFNNKLQTQGILKNSTS